MKHVVEVEIRPCDMPRDIHPEIVVKNKARELIRKRFGAAEPSEMKIILHRVSKGIIQVFQVEARFDYDVGA